MNRQVIQNFLNLPDLSGVALIDGRNRPFFFGPDIRLNSHQQDALAQGIQQVIETTPLGFDTCSFRFANQLVYLYKLDQGLILLVLTAVQTVFKAYQAAIRQLVAALMEEPHNVVPTFRLLAGCVTLNTDAGIPDNLSPVAPGATPTTTLRPAEILTALNHLSDGAIAYLGKIIVTNAWKQSCPAYPWLTQFEIHNDGHFTLGSPPEQLSVEQHQWIKEWVAAFLVRGGRTLRNFPELVSNQSLNPQEKGLLF